MSFALTPKVVQALTIWAHSNNASMHWPSPHDEVLVRSQTPISGSPHPDVVLAMLARLSELETALRESHAGAAGTNQARISGMEQHISELEKSLEHARKERDEALALAHDSVMTEADQHLSRLKPSGQVAGVRERLGAHLMDWAPTPFAGQSAVTELDRLAAKAQGYEVAVADNAALLGVLRRWLEADGDTEIPDLKDMTAKQRAAFVCYMEAHDVSGRSHPGAALLERMKRLEESKQALRKNAQTMKKALVGIRKAYNSWTPEMGTRASWNEISYWLDRAGH